MDSGLVNYLVSLGYDSDFAEDIYQVYTLHIGNWKQAIQDTFEELNNLSQDDDWPAEIIQDIENFNSDLVGGIKKEELFKLFETTLQVIESGAPKEHLHLMKKLKSSTVYVNRINFVEELSEILEGSEIFRRALITVLVTKSNEKIENYIKEY